MFSPLVAPDAARSMRRAPCPYRTKKTALNWCYHGCIQLECTGELKSSISIRGIDEKALARLKRRAQGEGSSLNALVTRVLEAEAGIQASRRAAKVFDDL